MAMCLANGMESVTRAMGGREGDRSMGGASERIMVARDYTRCRDGIQRPAAEYVCVRVDRILLAWLDACAWED